MIRLRALPALSPLALLCLVSASHAQDAATPRIEVDMQPDGAVAVGTPLTISLSLASPGYFVRSPDWPDMQIANAITREPPGVTRPGSQIIDGRSWTTVSRLYELTPQQAARFELPEQTISFAYADPETGAAVEATARVPAIAFMASVPAGAEGLSPYLAARSLSMDQSVDGPGDGAKVGASVTRTVTIEADGTQAMLIPPVLTATPPTGLHAYPREATLTDTPGQRGAAAQASRVESIVYIVEAPGDYTLPPATLRWWNPERRSIDSATVDGIAFTVAGAVAGDVGTSWLRMVLPVLSGLALLAILAFAARHRIARLGRAVTGSERVLFRLLMREVRQGDSDEIRSRMSRWLAAAGRDRMPDAVEAALYAVERWRFGQAAPADGEPAASRRRLADALVAARRTARSDTTHRPGPLPQLNPW